MSLTEPKVRVAFKKGLQGDLSFELGQMGAEAVVGPITKGKMVPLGAMNAEVFRGLEGVWIPIGTAQHGHDGGPPGDGDSANRDRLRSKIGLRAVNGSVEAENFINRFRPEGRIFPQFLQRARVLEQGMGPIAHQVGRGFEARYEQQKGHG